MKSKVIILLSLLLLLTVAVVQAQDEEPAEAPEADAAAPTCDHPRVVYLVDKTGADCQLILDLHAGGVGFGQIMKAAVVAEGIDGDWQELLAIHRAGTGWGQLGHAYGLQKRFARLDAPAEELLALKASGLGWGQIDKVYALAGADLGISEDRAAEMLRSGLGWEEIQAELGLEAGGPPPWAGGPKKDKFKNEDGPGNSGNSRGNGNND